MEPQQQQQPQPQQQQQQQQQRPLHIYFIPYLAAGHMNPLCDLATLFSSRGHHVTIITTPSNALSLQTSLPSAPSSLLRLHPVQISDGNDSFSSITDLTGLASLHRAAMLLRQPVEIFLEQNPPDCIVADFLIPWVDDVASDLQIPRLSFNGFSLFTLSAMESLRANPLPESHSGPFVIPDFPREITIPATPPMDSVGFMNNLMEIEVKSHGLIVNSFIELDGEEYLRHYERITGHRAWHLGPASLVSRSNREKTERGQKSVVSESECLSWLDSKRLNSVLYICFGSLCRFPDNQLYEIACGLEASGCEFVWVVPEKKGKGNEESEEEWIPEGFDERNKSKGMIVRGWAPQLLILDHPAVGGFMTHCGWNSTLEAVSAGVPMITWPVHGDQFYNERLVTEVRGIGVEVGADEWRLIGFGERERLIGRDQVEVAVRRLMDGGDEATEIRRRAVELRNKARQALAEGGSSYNNLTSLIHELQRFRDSKPT